MRQRLGGEDNARMIKVEVIRCRVVALGVSMLHYRRDGRELEKEKIIINLFTRDSSQ